MIINYNDYPSTKHLVDNIKKYKCLDEIVVVDNNSSDNSFEMLKQINCITLIKTDKNNGFSYGINYGIKSLEKKYDNAYVFISNSDIVIKEENDLKKLLESARKYELVAPRVNEHGFINRGWKLPTPKEEILFNLPYLRTKLEKKYRYYQDNYYNSNITCVDVVSFCFFLTTIKTIQENGYFDDYVFLYYEENIFCSKLKKKRKQIVIDNRVEIIHNHSVTIDKNIKKINKYKLLKQSQMYFEKKYNEAGIIGIVLLYLTNKMTLFLLYIYYFFKGGIR